MISVLLSIFCRARYILFVVPRNLPTICRKSNCAVEHRSLVLAKRKQPLRCLQSSQFFLIVICVDQSIPLLVLVWMGIPIQTISIFKHRYLKIYTIFFTQTYAIQKVLFRVFAFDVCNYGKNMKIYVCFSRKKLLFFHNGKTWCFLRLIFVKILRFSSKCIFY